MQPSGRVLTVSLNPAVDVIYRIDQFHPGGEQEAQVLAHSAGGKANNVARVVAALGHSAVATGFLGGGTGEFIERALRDAGVTPKFLPIAAGNRTCITIVDRSAGTQTLVREPGPLLSEGDLPRFLDHFTRLLRGIDFVVLSGALPEGIPTDFYGELVRTAYRVAQVRCVVDAEGAALRKAVPAQPYLVKPNRRELAEWAGRPLNSEREVLAAAQELMEAGPLIVAVSLGPDGLILTSPEGSWWAVPPQSEVFHTIGSGDALVAGLLAGLMEGRTAEEILRIAVACGTANVSTPGIAQVDPLTVAQLLRQVRVKRLM